MKYSDAILMTPELVGGKPQTPLAIFMERCNWSQLPLKHYWNFGYHSHSIMKIVNALPLGVATPFKRLAETLQGIAEESSMRLRKASAATQFLDDRRENSVEMPRIVDSWDEEKIYGLIEMDFDPEFQTRENFAANRRASFFWRLSNVEFMDRFVQNHVPLQVTELDWVRAFSMYVSRYFEDSVNQYLRFTFNIGDNSESFLVCMTTSKKFNRFGRISKVRPSRHDFLPTRHIY